MSAFVDISEELDGEEMPLCPLCDQPIFYGEEIAVARSGVVMALAHNGCCELPGAHDIEGEI